MNICRRNVHTYFVDAFLTENNETGEILFKRLDREESVRPLNAARARFADGVFPLNCVGVPRGESERQSDGSILHNDSAPNGVGLPSGGIELQPCGEGAARGAGSAVAEHSRSENVD